MTVDASNTSSNELRNEYSVPDRGNTLDELCLECSSSSMMEATNSSSAQKEAVNCR